MGEISNLISDVGSALANLTKWAIKKKASHDADKIWKQRRKEAFYKHVEKYVDENGALDVDNFISRNSLYDAREIKPIKNSRYAILNSKESKNSKYELMLTSMNCINEIKDVSLETIHAKNDKEAIIKASHLIMSRYLKINKKNFTHAHISNINRFFKVLKIDDIEMSKYIEILYYKQTDDLLGFYIRDENGVDINFNHFEVGEE